MDGTLAEDLRQAIGELVRAVRTADTMPPGESAILAYLERDGPQTTADLAHRRGVTHQSASKSVKGLLAEGLVRTTPHTADGRKLLVCITDRGHARLREERAHRADSLDVAIRSVLSSEELERVRDCIPLLNRLTVRLSKR